LRGRSTDGIADKRILGAQGAFAGYVDFVSQPCVHTVFGEAGPYGECAHGRGHGPRGRG